jgi:hypothetical protein
LLIKEESAGSCIGLRTVLVQVEKPQLPVKILAQLAEQLELLAELVQIRIGGDQQPG